MQEHKGARSVRAGARVLGADGCEAGARDVRGARALGCKGCEGARAQGCKECKSRCKSAGG